MQICVDEFVREMLQWTFASHLEANIAKFFSHRPGMFSNACNVADIEGNRRVSIWQMRRTPHRGVQE